MLWTVACTKYGVDRWVFGSSWKPWNALIGAFSSLVTFTVMTPTFVWVGFQATVACLPSWSWVPSGVSVIPPGTRKDGLSADPDEDDPEQAVSTGAGARARATRNVTGGRGTPTLCRAAPHADGHRAGTPGGPELIRRRDEP